MGTRLHGLKLQLQIGSGGVRMIGIWGIGGGGKTTLASSLYIEISGKFDSCCFLGNIKDESSKLQTLQEKILSDVFKREVKVSSVDIGKEMIKSRLRRKNVLIVLDDVDDFNQLEALAGSHDWFGDGSRVIITTRDEHLLRTHRVDEVCHVSLLSDEEAIRLFNRRAYNENKRVEDYKMLSQRVVSYAAGLPLALVVLGSFLYDKNTEEWISTLDRLKDIPEMEIVKKLKISYDGLKSEEKELFLDIACFFRGMKKDEAMVMLDACGFHPRIGVKVLIQKGLVAIKSSVYGFGKTEDVFDMHDLVQEMGHYIVKGEYPNSPEKHSRLWLSKAMEDMCSQNATMENNITEAIMFSSCPSNFGKLVSCSKKLRLLSLYNYYGEGYTEAPKFLSNELQYMFWESYPAFPFPESFQPQKLVVLKLKHSLQKKLWRGYKNLPCLKELHLIRAHHLRRTPDFGGLPFLQNLTLNCRKLKEIHPSLGHHTRLVYVNVTQCDKLRKFPTIFQMGKLESLKISYCYVLRKFLKIEANMDNLVNLSLNEVGIQSETLPCSVGSLKLKKPPFIRYLPRLLKRLTLCNYGLKDGEIPGDICELSCLQELDLSLNNFSRLNFSLCQLTRLKLLNLGSCALLVELPKLPQSIAVLKADLCGSLKVDEDIYTNCKWLCRVSIKKGNSVVFADRLLQTMLQGNAIENGCMSLQLKGLEIPRGFKPRLLRAKRCRLQLPENWCNRFSGFLICVVLRRNWSNSQYITMKHGNSGALNMDYERDAYWEECDGDVETWVWYVSFGTMKDTLWWDPKSNNVEFSIFFEVAYQDGDRETEPGPASGFGVRLVSKTTQTAKAETNSAELAGDYTCKLSILKDSKSVLKFKLSND